MGKKNMRRVTLLITAQTAGNLRKLADMAGYKEPGKVVDKLVRDKMLSLHVNAGRSEKRETETLQLSR